MEKLKVHFRYHRGQTTPQTQRWSPACARLEVAGVRRVDRGAATYQSREVGDGGAMRERPRLRLP